MAIVAAKQMATDIDNQLISQFIIEDRLEQGWHQLQLNGYIFGNTSDVSDWLKTTVGLENYYVPKSGGVIVFRNEADLVFFKLRWI